MKAYGLLVAACLVMSGCTVHITSPQVNADTKVKVQKPESTEPVPVTGEPLRPSAEPAFPRHPGRPVKPVRPLPPPQPIHSIVPVAPPSYAPAIAVVKGHVHDADGERIDTGVTVKVRSLNPNYPYEAASEVNGGSYVLNGVPAGVQLEFFAGGPGYTEVRRVETLLPQGFEHAGNTVNFGGEKTEADPAAPKFALYWLEDDYEVPPEEEEARVFGIRGTLFGTRYEFVEGAQVTVRSLHPDYPYESSMEATDGEYEFTDVPPGVPVSITVSAPGYAAQSRIEIVKPPNEDGTLDEHTNVFDFGGDQSPEFALQPLQATLSTYVKGQVCDESGAGLEKAQVQVMSLNPEYPYLATVDVVSGHYTVNEVPAGIQLEITVIKEGYQTSSRVAVLAPLETPTDQNVINFGCASEADAAAGEFVIKK